MFIVVPKVAPGYMFRNTGPRAVVWGNLLLKEFTGVNSIYKDIIPSVLEKCGANPRGPLEWRLI